MTRAVLPFVKSTIDTISVTERSSFRECRRSWYLSDVMLLEPKISSPRFWFGTMIHAALETYYNSDRDLDQALDRFAAEVNVTIPEIRKKWGMVWDGVKEEYSDHVQLGVEMLKNYSSYEHTLPPWTAIATEQRVWVPILTTTGRQARSGKLPMARLTARMDLLADVGDGSEDNSIVDHKTAAQKPSEGRSLDIDDQLTGYAYVYWRLTGELPRQMIYNVLIKAVPGPPRVVSVSDKNPLGRLSKDKQQKTTYGLYLQELQTRGEDPTGYDDILASLQAEGWSDYFSRTSTTRNLDQLKSYEDHLYFEYRDMLEVVRDPRKAYPSPSPMRCPSCPFLSVCQAMEDGGDFESLIERSYNPAEEKRW